MEHLEDLGTRVAEVNLSRAWEGTWYRIGDVVGKRDMPKGCAHHCVEIARQKGLGTPSA